MDRGRMPTKFLGNTNNKIYMDLKDIIREHALPFLPAKSLRRFTGVCRDWKLLISTPFFAHNQSNAFRASSGFFVQTQSGPPEFISLDPNSCGVPDPSLKFLPEAVNILSSSNGLLCCQGLTGDNAYYVCNPATKRWKKLPKPTADHGRDPAVVLVFEPSRLNFVAEYKLVCAFTSEDADFGNEFEIYSSSEGSWRISGEICYGRRGILPRSGVYVDGVVYWKGAHSVLAFDLTMERSKLIESFHPYGTLGAMNGKLCCVSMLGNRASIFVLKNAHASTMQMGSYAWKEVKEQSFNFTLSPARYDQRSVLFIGDDYVVVRHDKSLYSCDMKTKEVKSLTTSCRSNAIAIGYVNSLIEL